MMMAAPKTTRGDQGRNDKLPTLLTDSMIIKKQDGFTLVELMITMVIFVMVIAAMSNIFSGLLNQFKQQSKIAESNIEGVVGLELMRYDIEQAGFGLPWALTWNGLSVTYSEAVSGSPTTNSTADLYNDTDVPRAFVLADNIVPVAANDPGLNNSDYLVIKATNVATNNAAHKYTTVTNTGATNMIQVWDTLVSADDNLAAGDRVIVLEPISSGQSQRALVNDGTNFSTAFNSSPGTFSTSFQPQANSSDTFLIYGIKTAGSPVVEPRMPFNRADYYVRRPTTNMPARCAPGSGVLYKATINHANGELMELPLLDCVADMQVVIGADTSNPPLGSVNSYWTVTPAAAAPPAVTVAETIRNQVKDIRIYILAHEGQKDPSFSYTNVAPVTGCVGSNQVCIIDSQGGANVLLKAVTVPDLNYRWKVYTVMAAPYNLR